MKTKEGNNFCEAFYQWWHEQTTSHAADDLGESGEAHNGRLPVEPGDEDWYPSKMTRETFDRK